MKEKLKILIITDYFPPANSIASLRPYSWAKHWSKLGHNITVLTTTKITSIHDLNFDCSMFRVIEIKNDFRTKIIEKFGKKRVNNVSEKNKTDSHISIKRKCLNSIKKFLLKRGIFYTARMPDMNDFIISKSFKSIKNDTWDLVISTAGPYTEHLIALKIKERNKATFWIADYRDLWTQSHNFKGLFPFTLMEEYLEKKVNKRADMITTVSEPLAKQIRDKYNLTNIEIIENGFDFDDLENISKEKFWDDGKIRLVYTGSIYQGKQDPSPLFEAIKKISKSDKKDLLEKFEVLFVGVKADLDELTAKYGVSRWINYGGFVSREDSLRIQRDAHALIFLEFYVPGIDGILTGKLFEYICSGTQILGIGGINNSTSYKLIKDSGHGINFGRDSERIQEYLVDLLVKNTKYTFKKNQKIVEKYSRKALAIKLLQLTYQYETKYKKEKDK